MRQEATWLKDKRPVWGEYGWNVFLDSEQDVRRAIQYVEQNPPKEHKPRQRWSFVVPFGS